MRNGNGGIVSRKYNHAVHKFYLFGLAHWSTEQHADRPTNRTTTSPPSPCVGGPWRGATLGQPDSGVTPFVHFASKRGAQRVEEAERPPPKGTDSGKQPGGGQPLREGPTTWRRGTE